MLLIPASLKYSFKCPYDDDDDDDTFIQVSNCKSVVEPLSGDTKINLKE